MSHALRVCVVGAGAIGGFFGIRLAAAGANVSVLARGATLEAIRSRGWALQSGDERRVAPVRAVASTAELAPQDVVILAVKAPALPGIARSLAPLLGPETIVIPALNGVPWWFTDAAAGLPVQGRLDRVDPAGELAANIPSRAVIGSVIYPACSTPEAGVVHLHSGSRVVFGEIVPATDEARLGRFVGWLRDAGFDAEASPDIRTEVWRKLLGNACFNPVSALTGSATDQLIDDPAVHALFETLMRETLAVGRALGIDPAIEPVDRIAITRRLGHVKTSMLQDVEAGRPLEIDTILGAVVELADRLGVPAPASRTLLALVSMRVRVLGLLPA